MSYSRMGCNDVLPPIIHSDSGIFMIRLVNFALPLTEKLGVVEHVVSLDTTSGVLLPQLIDAIPQTYRYHLYCCLSSCTKRYDHRQGMFKKMTLAT